MYIQTHDRQKGTIKFQAEHPCFHILKGHHDKALIFFFAETESPWAVSSPAMLLLTVN